MDDTALTALLADVKTIAVVGCSRHPHKAAHAIPRDLQAAGFRILPVSPYGDELLGEPVRRRLADIDEPVDLVDVFRPSDQTPQVVREAVEIGAPAVWLQLGIASAEARAIAEDAGVAYVEDRCLGVDVRRLGISPAP